MKYITLVVALAITGFSGLRAQNIETRELAPFENLRISRGINVTLVEGESPMAEIHIENAPTSEVVIEQNSKELSIRMKGRTYGNEVAVNVYLHFQNLKNINILSGGGLYSQWDIELEKLRIEAGSNTEIELLELTIGELEISAATTEIELAGEANIFRLNATVGADVKAGEFHVKEADIRANTGADIEIWVTEKLKARLGTGSELKYKGNPPVVESSLSLGAKIDAVEDFWD